MKAKILNLAEKFGRKLRNARLFVGVVVLPMVLAVIYFGFVAPDVYVSESHFLVRNQEHQGISGLGSLLQGSGISSSAAEPVYSVQDYLTSRDVLQQLDGEYHLNAAFNGGGIAGLERFTTSASDKTFEGLLRYYRKHIVETDFDTSSSILTLTVRAYTADASLKINESLLKLSEEFVNKMNARSREDLLKFSIADVADAEQAALLAVRAVSSYRNGEAVFDPDKQSALQLEQVARLQQDLLATSQQLADVRGVAVANPQIPVLQSRIKMLEANIATETAKVAGGQHSLSSKSADYDAVSIQRDFAAKRLELAQASLQAARENALKQQIYIERVAQPNKPDEAIEPKRLRNIAATLALTLVLFGLLSLVFGAVKDHVA
jgi:capsular polysaccharide transport system permease protein